MRRVAKAWSFRAAAALTLAAVVAASAGARVQGLGDRQLRERARHYEPLLAAAAARHRVDPRVLWTICFLETRFRPTLTSPAGAGGLMQLMPATARRFGLSPEERYVAERNIEAATRYVRFLTDTLGNNLDLVLAGYNAGEGAVMAFRDGRTIRLSSGKTINPRGIRTGGVPPYRETVNYVATGRAVFRALSGADVFTPELIARARTMTVGPSAGPQPGGDAGPEYAANATRSTYYAADASRVVRSGSSTYYADDGAPPERAVPLPTPDEAIAEVRAEAVAGESGGRRAVSRKTASHYY